MSATAAAPATTAAAVASRERQEVTIIGQLVGATNLASQNAHCTWNLRAGPSWIHLSGATHGVSQCDAPLEGGACVFQHPIDCVFEGGELRGWPRLELELRFLDAHGRSDIAGYAVAHVPTTPGVHRLRCPVWAPRGSLMDRITAFFIGGYPQLKDPTLIFGRFEDEDSKTLRRAEGDSRLSSAGNGLVHIDVGVYRRTIPEA
uniref:B9 domain-containing protein 2 n=1 Tax=Haptolina ericina TaxID=156174 RepID=A0A7S3AYN2_9EUKA|mmetsp:Transcript_39148/g.88940  ORF Transcript_39148/g.88940 Transcript_39148/m.88940 type:complete len:203 (+) Transcript_39148:82-690(+)